MKFLQASIIALDAVDGTPRSVASIWGYAVCLYPIKGMPGVNELIAKINIDSHIFACLW